MHSVTDRRTDRRTDGYQDDANSRSYCVAVYDRLKSLAMTLNVRGRGITRSIMWSDVDAIHAKNFRLYREDALEFANLHGQLVIWVTA